MAEERVPADAKALAKMIDHTLLKPDASRSQILQLCEEAKTYGFWSVCVNPYWVPLCVDHLRGTDVKVCTVIGFPLGATTPAAKAAEAAEAVRNGADEIDMVMNVGAMKSGDYQAVLDDMKAVRNAVGDKVVVKVILETGLLTDAEKVKACELAKEAGLDYVKTSTGFGYGGATVEDVALMRRTVGDALGVKASGGIRDRETALAMIRAGASRIGASASVKIVSG
ncbi:MAG TPA: deoxyribose-phosphate aldolase [Symbiobacteriaceae bacterium]